MFWGQTSHVLNNIHVHKLIRNSYEHRGIEEIACDFDFHILVMTHFIAKLV
jgi:hypothetical protein